MYPNTFYRVSIKALIKDAQNRILVIKENQDTWSLPGGGLDHGEDPRQGILREVNEELGITKAAVKDIAAIKTFHLKSKSTWLLWVVYKVEAGSEPFIFGEGVSDARFIDPISLAKSDDIFERTVYSVANQ